MPSSECPIKYPRAVKFSKGIFSSSLKNNYVKSSLMTSSIGAGQEVSYVGHLLTDQEIKPGPTKADAVSSIPTQGDNMAAFTGLTRSPQKSSCTPVFPCAPAGSVICICLYASRITDQWCLLQEHLQRLNYATQSLWHIKSPDSLLVMSSNRIKLRS